MSELTITELQEKIKLVEADIQNVQSNGETGRKLELLAQYKEYLEDEVRFLKNEERAEKLKNNL